MTSEMVERVAKALCDDTMRRWRSPIAMKDEPWKEFFTAAIAAIEAMREPTEEMVYVASDEMIRVNEESMGLSFSKLNKEMAKAAWSASVSAALKGSNNE